MNTTQMDKAKKIEVMIEFLVFGIVVGVIEDIVAVKIVTGESIDLKVIGIIVLIAIPFAVIGEIVVDNVDLAKHIRRILWRKHFPSGRTDDTDDS